MSLRTIRLSASRLKTVGAVSLLSLSMATMLSTSVRAQMQSREAIALQNQMLELRHQMQVLSDQVAAMPAGGGGSAYPRYRNPPPSNGGGASGDLVAGLLDRVGRLEEQVRTLQGQVDQTANQLQQQNADLTKQIGDLSFRLGNQASAQPGAAPAASPSRGGAPTSLSPQPGMLGSVPSEGGGGAQPPRTPEIALQQGNAALARRDYPAAEAAAREVLASRSPRIADGQYLLAQALSGERQYQQAALAYDDAYTRGRTSPHAPDALLGLANSLAAINEKRAACETLTRLRTDFPQLRPDLRDAAQSARQRAGCT